MRRLILVSCLPAALVDGVLHARGRGGGDTRSQSQPSIRISAERDLSRDVGIESEAALAADPENAFSLLAGSNVPRGERMDVYTSRDGGTHWTRMSVDPSAFFSFPNEVGDYEPLQTVALVSYSNDQGGHWSRPTLLAEQGSTLEVRLATSACGILYAVWREEKTGSIRLARKTHGDGFNLRTFVAGAVVDETRSCGGYRAQIPAQPRRCVSPNPVVSVDRSGGHRVRRFYVTWGTTSLNRSQDIYVAAFTAALKPLLGVGKVKQLNPPEGLRGPDQCLPASTVDDNDNVWACYHQSLGRAWRWARYVCSASTDGGASWPQPSASVASNETRHDADRSNGFGDYESVAAAGGAVYVVWTDGRSLDHRCEEIFGARLRLEREVRR